MPRTWSPERKQAASERARRQWQDARVRKAAGMAPAVAVPPSGQDGAITTPAPAPIAAAVPLPADPWETMPLADANRAVAALARDLQHARDVLNRRQQHEVIIHQCWTATHKSLAAPSVVAQCRKDIPDGKWVFRDDEPRDPATGLCAPVMVCSMACYTTYMAQRGARGLSRR